MKSIMKFLVSCTLCAILPALALGGNPSKRGTAGAMELLMPAGARGNALSGSAISLSSGVDAIYWNPAGLAGGLGTSGGEALFSHTSWIADMAIDYFGVGVGIGEIGSLGLTLKSLNFGTIKETTEDFPDGTGNTFSPTYLTLGLTYSKQLTDRISVGFTMKYISETIMRTSAQGIAIDGGVIYNVTGHSPLEGLRFGAVIKNIGPNMEFTGGNLERDVVPPQSDPNAKSEPMAFKSQSFELPSTFELGLSYDLNIAGNNRITVFGTFQNANFSNDQYRGGLEYAFNEQLFLRIGYSTPDADKSNHIEGLSFGGGVELPIGGFSLGVDYSFTKMDFFNNVQTIAMHLGF